MSTKSNDDLEKLHGVVAEVLLRSIEDGVPLIIKGTPILDENGEIIMAPPSPALLNAAIKFLKDNGISEDFTSSPRSSAGPQLNELIRNGDFPFEPNMEDIA